MNLGFVAHAYPRFAGDVSGAFLERLAVALVRRGHRVRVITPADAGRGGLEQRDGVEITWVRYAPAARETLAHRGTMLDAARSPLGMLWGGSLVWRQARAAARHWTADRLDLLHAHWWAPGGLSARWSRRPYVLTMHGMDVVLLERWPAARWLARRIVGAARAVTVVSSELAARAALLLDLPRERFLVQPMPIEVGHFSRVSAGGGGLVTVGRLMPRKRFDLLLDALNLLRSDGRTLPLTIIGDGPEREKLERRARALRLEGQVRFTGAVAPDQVPRLIGDADVFAFPALGEGFGLVAAESLLLGVPVVGALDGGGVTDVVPTSGGGRLVEATAPALARAIRELLDDPDARRLAAEAGQALQHRLTPEAVAGVFEGVYSRAIGAPA